MNKRIVEHESYKPDEIYKQGVRKIDFLPSIDPRSPKDMDILKTWQQHFEQQGIPYAVVAWEQNGKDKLWKLYKELRCEYMPAGRKTPQKSKNQNDLDKEGL